MMSKVARPTVPPALLYAPNIIANTEVAMAAARQATGKNFSRQIPNGSSQPNTNQKLPCFRQCQSAMKKLTGALA